MYLATSFALFDSLTQSVKSLLAIDSFAAIQTGRAFEELDFQIFRRGN